MTCHRVHPPYYAGELATSSLRQLSSRIYRETPRLQKESFFLNYITTMPIRINSTIVYGTYKVRQRKFKVSEDGAHYVKDENGQLIPDGWEYYTMHAVWANCLCAFVYKYRDKETGEKMYRFDYAFFNDLSHARRCFKGGWGENIVSARFNVATPEGRKLAALFVQNGIKVTPYSKPLKIK